VFSGEPAQPTKRPEDMTDEEMGAWIRGMDNELDPAAVKNTIILGAYHIERGVRDVPAWSAEMGKSIKEWVNLTADEMRGIYTTAMSHVDDRTKAYAAVPSDHQEKLRRDVQKLVGEGKPFSVLVAHLKAQGVPQYTDVAKRMWAIAKAEAGARETFNPKPTDPRVEVGKAKQATAGAAGEAEPKKPIDRQASVGHNARVNLAQKIAIAVTLLAVAVFLFVGGHRATAGDPWGQVSWDYTDWGRTVADAIGILLVGGVVTWLLGIRRKRS